MIEQATERSSSPSVAVVERVAALDDVDPTELEPLFETIDPEALDGLVESTTDSEESGLQVRFEYQGYEVTVTADGEVHTEAEGETSTEEIGDRTLRT